MADKPSGIGESPSSEQEVQQSRAKVQRAGEWMVRKHHIMHSWSQWLDYRSILPFSLPAGSAVHYDCAGDTGLVCDD